jgi:hypothetical protein
MSIAVQRFEERHIDAVKAFNARIAAKVDELETRLGGAAHSRLPESVVPSWLPPVEGSALREERFVAVEGDEVRGGYTLKFQEFRCRGEMRTMAGWHEPVSEGIIDKKYGAVGMILLSNAMRTEPHLYCTAMGGIETVLPKFLKAMRWKLALSSFHFYIHRPYRFFRGLRHLRRDRVKALALDAAAFLGFAWAGVRTMQAWRRKRVASSRWTVEDSFGDWADDVWERSRDRYSVVAVRSADVLRRLFPNPDRRFGPDIGPCYVVLRVEVGGATVGWALVMRSQMKSNPYFGDLRVGAIVDCLAAPEDAPAVIAAATEYLDAENVDLTYTNQFSRDWQDALRDTGYLKGPSNYGLAFSPAAAAPLEPLWETLPSIHITRGDGEGPVHRRTMVTEMPLPPTVEGPRREASVAAT